MRRFALVALLALGLTSCSTTAPAGGPSEADDVVAVETAFLEALVDGNGEAALALTTLGENDLTCAAVVSDYADLHIGVIKPKVGEASVDGDTATVEFSYSMIITAAVEEISGTHTLVRDGDSWLIDFPEEYRIRATVSPDVVVEAGILPNGSGSIDERVCTAPAVNDTYELIALPGRYMVGTSDPTGVFHRSEYVTSVSVYDTDKPVTPLLDYIQDSERLNKAAQVRDLLAPYVDRCAASGFTDPTCQDGLPIPEGPVSISDHPGTENISIFSKDGLTWQFQAGGESFLFQRNGGIEAVEMYYTGTVLGDGTLYVTITVD